ncbi:MAG: tetratricopeptide repeat protein, partial [Cyanobacteria bacterium J06636_16]
MGFRRHRLSLTASSLLLSLGISVAGISVPQIFVLPALAQTSDSAAALREEGQRLLYSGQIAAASDILQQALEQAQQANDRASEAATWRVIGVVQLAQNDKPAAAESAQQALTLYRDLDDPVGEAYALQVLAATTFEDVPNETTFATIQQALDLVSEFGSPIQQGLLWADLGNYYSQLEEFETALAHLNEAQMLLAGEPASTEESRYRDNYEPFILAIKGWAQLELGSPKAASNTLEQAIALGAARNNPNAEGLAHFFQGLVLVGQGDLSGGAMSYRQAADRLAAAEQPAFQFEVLLGLGDVYSSQAFSDFDNRSYKAAVTTYQQALDTYQEALQVAQSLDETTLTVRALNEISSASVSIAYTFYDAADQSLTNGDARAAYREIESAITFATEGVQPALDALELVTTLSDEALTQETYEIANTAHIATGQSHDFQGVIYRAGGLFEESLTAFQAAVPWFEAGLPYALASGNPAWPAQLRYNMSLSYTSQALSHSILGQYEAGTAPAQVALEVAQQIPSRERVLVALHTLQDLYSDVSEAAEETANYERALAYAEQSLAYAEQSLALAEQPLEDRSAFPHADALPDDSIIDTEAEQQYWIQAGLEKLWLSFGNLAFLYDEQEDSVKALELFQETLAAAERLEDPQLIAITLGAISGSHVELSQYPEALAIEARIADIATETNDTELWFSSTLSRANIYDDLGRYPEAIAAYEQVYVLAKEQGRLANVESALNNLGVIYTFQGNYNAALENFNQNLSSARAIRAQLEAPDGLDKLDEYCYLADLQIRDASGASADSTPAADAYGVALETFDELLEEESAERTRQLCIESTWDTEQKQLNNMAIVYEDQGRYREAIALYEQSLDVVKTWGTLADRATTLNNLGNTYLQIGEYDTALAIYQEAIAIRRDIGDRSGLAHSLNSIGTAYSWQGRYDQSLMVYQEALALTQAIGLKPPETALRGNIGSVYAEQGQYDAAQTHYDASLSLSQELGLLPTQAVQLSHLSDLASKRGNYPQALDYAEQSLDIYRDIGARLGERVVLGQLGNVYQAQGDFADALAIHEEALALARDLKDQDDEAYALLELGKTYLQLGQYEQASQFYQEGLVLFRKIGSVVGEANALRFLGNVADRQEQPTEALAFYEQALAIYRDSGSVVGEHLTLIDRGLAQRKLGDLAAAESTLEESLTIQRSIGAQANEGVTLAGLALVRHAKGTPQEAFDLLQEALALHQKLGDRPNEAATLSEMGQLLAAQSQPELAIALLKQSVNLYESIRGDLRSLDTDLQASYTDSIADTYRTLADLLLSQNRVLEAQRVLDLLKIQELDEYFQDVQRSAETASGVDFWQVETDLLALYQQVLEQTVELQALEAKSPDTLTDQEKQRLAELRSVRDQAEGWFYDFLDDPTVVAAVDQIRTNSRGQNLEPENFP